MHCALDFLRRLRAILPIPGFSCLHSLDPPKSTSVETRINRRSRSVAVPRLRLPTDIYLGLPQQSLYILPEPHGHLSLGFGIVAPPPFVSSHAMNAVIGLSKLSAKVCKPYSSQWYAGFAATFSEFLRRYPSGKITRFRKTALVRVMTRLILTEFADGHRGLKR